MWLLLIFFKFHNLSDNSEFVKALTIELFETTLCHGQKLKTPASLYLTF